MFVATPTVFPAAFGCHGLVPWRIHVRQLDSSERDTPRDKPVASSWPNGQARGIFRDPRGKPVASWPNRASRGIFMAQRDMPVASLLNGLSDGAPVLVLRGT